MKTVVIGLDGGEWDVINPMIADGKLPTLAELKRQGVSGPLESVTPPVSPLAWTSIQTGTNPGKHGIFDFSTFEEDYRRRSINSADRAATPFWQILNDHGTTTGLFKVPFTYPPDDISGYMVTGFPTPNTVDDFAVPESLADQVGPVERMFEDGSLKKDGDFVAFKKNLIEVAERQTDLFVDLLREYDSDFAMTVYDGSDRIQHFFWKYFDPSHPRYEPNSPLVGAIEEYYETVDEGIGRILDVLDEECDVVVLSDHGFGPLTHDIHIDKWLEQEGFLVRRSGTSTRKVTGDALTAALKLGWAAVKRTNLDQLIKSILPPTVVKFNQHLQDETHRDISWSETQAFFTTLSGQSLYINHENRFADGIVSEEQYEAVVEEVRDSLLSIHHPETDEQLVEEVVRKEEVFEGWLLDDAPDLIVRSKPEYTMKGGRSESLLQPSSQKGDERSGDHRSDGILIASGPSFGRGTYQAATVLDIAPTLLHLHRAPVPKTMDGTVLEDILSDTVRDRRQIERTDGYGRVKVGDRQWSIEEESELEERLSDMGYLG